MCSKILYRKNAISTTQLGVVLFIVSMVSHETLAQAVSWLNPRIVPDLISIKTIRRSESTVWTIDWHHRSIVSKYENKLKKPCNMSHNIGWYKHIVFLSLDVARRWLITIFYIDLVYHAGRKAITNMIFKCYHISICTNADGCFYNHDNYNFVFKGKAMLSKITF